MTNRYSLITNSIAASLVFSLSYLAALPVHAKSRRPKHSQSLPVTSRTFEFIYQLQVPATKNTDGNLLLWVPLPQQDTYQRVEKLSIESVAEHEEGREGQYGNSYVLFRPTPAQLEKGFDATIRFVATRYEHRVELDSTFPRLVAGKSGPDPSLQKYLEPDRLVPAGGAIGKLAEAHTAGDADALSKARQIYDYVVSTLHYEKSREGSGHGDDVWTNVAKRGNDAGFTSLVVGMMRSASIPARFETGFSLPESKTQGELYGYHCWAEFYVEGIGWVPVDALEGQRSAAKRDYFFGAHDANRVLFSFGRDLRFSNEQKGEAPNYFIYPYAELDGRPFTELQTHFAFNDLAVTYATQMSESHNSALLNSPLKAQPR